MNTNILCKNAKRYVLLYSCFLLYSMVGVCAKFAARHPLISVQAILLYSSCLALLGLYAILWQQILKRLSLTVAFANKAVTIPLGLLWGTLFFGEVVRWNMILGSAVIGFGVMLMVTRNE